MIAVIRTLVFYFLFYGPFTIFWATFAGLVSWLLPRRWRYGFIILVWSYVVLWSARWVLGIRWQVLGREHLPKDQTLVIVANHQSAWETFFLQVLVNPQSQVIKRSLLNIPFFGWTYSMVRPIAINRLDKRSAIQELVEQGKQRLETGNHVLIFPEGTRRPVGQPGSFTRSAAILAKQADVHLLPISHDAGRLWPRDLFSVKRAGIVTVRIYPPVAVGEQKTAEVMEGISTLINGAGQESCEQLLGEARSEEVTA
ncbi:MAG: lysophospholipid acyltransferase family protein [Natronospirillum sp.]